MLTLVKGEERDAECPGKMYGLLFGDWLLVVLESIFSKCRIPFPTPFSSPENSKEPNINPFFFEPKKTPPPLLFKKNHSIPPPKNRKKSNLLIFLSL